MGGYSRPWNNNTSTHDEYDTNDGDDLSRNISHVTAGIKINDCQAIEPIIGIPIGFQDATKLQSRELCYPSKILIAKDTKVLYKDYFTDFLNS
jgi:hypothetical protein